MSNYSQLKCKSVYFEIKFKLSHCFLKKWNSNEDPKSQRINQTELRIILLSSTSLIQIQKLNLSKLIQTIKNQLKKIFLRKKNERDSKVLNPKTKMLLLLQALNTQIRVFKQISLGSKFNKWLMLGFSHLVLTLKHLPLQSYLLTDLNFKMNLL